MKNRIRFMQMLSYGSMRTVMIMMLLQLRSPSTKERRANWIIMTGWSIARLLEFVVREILMELIGTKDLETKSNVTVRVQMQASPVLEK